MQQRMSQVMCDTSTTKHTKRKEDVGGNSVEGMIVILQSRRSRRRQNNEEER